MSVRIPQFGCCGFRLNFRRGREWRPALLGNGWQSSELHYPALQNAFPTELTAPFLAREALNCSELFTLQVRAPVGSSAGHNAVAPPSAW